jgi:hypothetical protein
MAIFALRQSVSVKGAVNRKERGLFVAWYTLGAFCCHGDASMETICKQRGKWTKERQSESAKKYREANREKCRASQHDYYIKNKSKIERRNFIKYGNSHDLVTRALKSGRLIKQPCQECGNPRSRAHHCDYNDSLNVIWFCKKHHIEWHKTNTPIYWNGVNLFGLIAILGPKEPNQIRKPISPNYTKGEKVHCAKLCASDVIKIREDYSSGKFSYNFLAKRYGVAQSAIINVVTRRTWKHIP